jgi:hypothetical protein
MWLTIISTLLGILASVAPNAIKYFERKQEIAYETEITKLRLEAAQQGYALTTEVQSGKDMVSEGESIRQYDAQLDGGKFINFLRASVRPVVTYIFFGLYVVVKLAITYILVTTNGLTIENYKEFSAIILDEPTMTFLATCGGFWFGARSFEKMEQIVSNGFGKQSNLTTVTKQKK